MKTFQAPAIISSISYTKDGGVRLSLLTQELSNEEKVLVGEFYQTFGYVLFRPNAFQDSEIPTEEAEEGNKTPSRRLRSVLFVYWKQLGKKGDFDVWYREQVEKFIDVIKKKLDKGEYEEKLS